MTKKIKMTVNMDVTIPQALALQAMFETWNAFASTGHSNIVGFYVDGDGNFQPHCEWAYSEEIPAMTDKLRESALMENALAEVSFDFDPIAWELEP